MKKLARLRVVPGLLLVFFLGVGGCFSETAVADTCLGHDSSSFPSSASWNFGICNYTNVDLQLQPIGSSQGIRCNPDLGGRLIVKKKGCLSLSCAAYPSESTLNTCNQIPPQISGSALFNSNIQPQYVYCGLHKIGSITYKATYSVTGDQNANLSPSTVQANATLLMEDSALAKKFNAGAAGSHVNFYNQDKSIDSCD